MVYGIFRDSQNHLMILKGEITHQDGYVITVSFDGYYQTYNEYDIGKTLFHTEDEAEAAVEELRRKMKWV